MYWDLLARIKNAYWAKKDTVTVPLSKFDLSIAKALVAAGYLAAADKRSSTKKNLIDIRLKYDDDGRPSLTDFRLISKPSRRIYLGYREIHPVKQNFGTAVVSTPEGVMLNKEAKKKKLGGEYLFEVW